MLNHNRVQLAKPTLESFTGQMTWSLKIMNCKKKEGEPIDENGFLYFWNYSSSNNSL